MLLFVCLYSLQCFQTEEVIYLKEELQYQVPGIPAQGFFRHIYVGETTVRTDFVEEHLRLVYDLVLGTLIVADMDNKTYYLSRPGRDKRLTRAPFWNIAPLDDGMLTIKQDLLTLTGASALISGQQCREFKINYQTGIGTSTRIWATTRMNTDWSAFKKIWQAASGTIPPKDVKDVHNRIFKEMRWGAPLRLITTIEQDGFKITTTSTFVEIDRKHSVNEAFFKIPNNFEIIQGEISHRPWQQK